MTVRRVPSSDRSLLEQVEFLLNVVNQMCIGFVTIYMSWFCLRLRLASTALHAWLVTLGFIFLMAEAIMCHYSGNVITFHYQRSTKTTIHWILQALGGSLGVAGCLYELIQQGFLLESTHGKLGFSALIFCMISLVSGLSALFSASLKQFLSPLLNKSFHNLLGTVAFILALVAQFYGYDMDFFITRTTTDFQTMFKTITMVSLVLTSIGPLKALYHKISNILNLNR